MHSTESYAIGIDIGSTTVKAIVLGTHQNVIFHYYHRHFANMKESMLTMMQELQEIVRNTPCTVSVTGSGGINFAKQLEIPFVQEVLAVTSATQKVIPQTDVVIELGGEDAKLIFLRNGAEQRMNGICAGGTGSFIDQMAALLQTDAMGLNKYAEHYRVLYPIAARCGVFAKSDIQPLINDGVAKEDIAASIFQAVVNQTISGLACGRKIRGNIAFLGGPLHYLPELRKAFIRTLRLKDEEIIIPADAHLFAAKGAAFYSMRNEKISFSQLKEKLASAKELTTEMHRLPTLFQNEKEYEAFQRRQEDDRITQIPLEQYCGKCFLGVDAGSTTMKLVLIGEKGELLYSYYGSNCGDPGKVFQKAFAEINAAMSPNAEIAYSCSTGYGETLIKDAFHLDEGEVETIAHYYAARHFEPEVDCILDIGGQDMKYIKIKNHAVDTIILNEACSSGCGSFIENFANSLGYSAEEFAKLALKAKNPVDLGTRCTIFMNSNVKQAQKEGIPPEDIAAGLAYSVIKNALFKVIKLTDITELGNKVLVQGGTFYNDAVLCCFEKIIGKEVIRPQIAGLMGAFGAALIAKERWQGKKTSLLTIDDILSFSAKTHTTHCKGCQNHCRLTVNTFPDGKRHFSGNRCEKGTQAKQNHSDTPNLFEYKRNRLFQYPPLPKEKAHRGIIGIPRVLNLYENYPFWAVFFRELGFHIVLSPYSDREIFRLGMDSIPSESECYPAKLAHGHIKWLINQKVPTIFYPCITYERKESPTACNHFNCPMVISYAENIKNNMDELNNSNVRYLNPFIAFTDEKVLSNRLARIMKKEFNIEKKEVQKAVQIGWKELMRCKQDILERGESALRQMREHGGHGIVLAGRPYHLDPEINHGIPEMIQSFGFTVFTEDSIAQMNTKSSALRVANQWTYHARLYQAAEFAGRCNDLDFIQLNSFGCGLDAITTDQIHELLSSAGKLYTLLKIDEVNNLGAAKIRVRSMFAAIQARKQNAFPILSSRGDYQRVYYTKEMQRGNYTILCTEMSPFHFDFFAAAMESCGYNLVMLKNEGQNVTDMGLRYVNNDACYPAMIVTGQIIDAVTSGKYNTDHLAVMMAQTGGGCRATNYIGFIRKALKEAGYPQIPVISVNAGGLEKNPGFHISGKMLVKLFQAATYGDILMQAVHRTRPYEAKHNSVNTLYESWRTHCIHDIKHSILGMSTFYQNCHHIIYDFNHIPLNQTSRRPQVGIVGEILVKFMPLANNHLTGILEEEEAEAIIPDLIGFMKYCLSNTIYRKKYLGGSSLRALGGSMLLKILDLALKPIDKDLSNSSRFQKPGDLKTMQQEAEKIIQLGNQCGEGWYLAAEIIHLIQQGCENIVCVQPFGCLPNHIVGKGILKKIKEQYPQANIVAIDYDPGASKVNQLNRIKLMLEVAKDKKTLHSEKQK